ncbi:hypothetical protein FPOAC2_13197 [Fusarium poae]
MEPYWMVIPSTPMRKVVKSMPRLERRGSQRSHIREDGGDEDAQKGGAPVVET